MLKTVELHISSDPLLLSVLRAVMNQVCQLAAFSQREISKIVLAVDEACSNVMRHAYKGQLGKPIQVTCTISANTLEIIMVDYGIPLEPQKIKSRDLNELRPGGLGVYLIKSVMDSVVYSHEHGKNKLVMTKSLPKRKLSESENTY